MLSAHEAVALCKLLEQHRIRFWVMGGWGVDALLHRQTRSHKDLDLLVALGDLPLLWKVFEEQGFTLQYVWEENCWVDGEPDRWPTAFVAADAQERVLDVHVIDFGPDAPSSSITTIRGLSLMRSPGRGASPTRRSPVSPRRRNSPCTPATPCQMDSYRISNCCKRTDVPGTRRLGSHHNKQL